MWTMIGLIIIVGGLGWALRGYEQDTHVHELKAKNEELKEKLEDAEALLNHYKGETEELKEKLEDAEAEALLNHFKRTISAGRGVSRW